MDRACLTLGLLAVAVAVFWRLWLAREKKRHEAMVAQRIIVQGTITDNVESSGESTVYNAVVAYQADGTEYKFVYSDDSYIPWPIGNKIDVAYDPQKPSDAIEARYDDRWDKKLLTFLALCGVAFAIAAWTGSLGFR